MFLKNASFVKSGIEKCQLATVIPSNKVICAKATKCVCVLYYILAR